MEYKTITRKDPEYPRKIMERLGDEGPDNIYYNGPLEFLDRFTMGVICADSLGGIAFNETNQLLFTIREYDMNYIGGWHSVMETEIFRLGLFRKNTTVTLFSPKGLEVETFDSFLLDRFYPPLHEFPERDEYFRRAGTGELLMLSVADPSERRFVRKNIMQRNLVACALADIVFIPYGPKGSKTYTMAKRVIKANIPAFTIDHDISRDLHNLGIPRYTRKSVKTLLEERGARLPDQEDNQDKPVKIFEVPSYKAPPPEKPVQTEMKFGEK